MTGLAERTREFIDWAEGKADPRTKDWFLMPTPYVTYGLAALYLFIVWKGPKFMENRKPFELRKFMIGYNAVLVMISTYIFSEFLISVWPRPSFSWACQSVDYSDDPIALRLANATWLFYLSKIIEFMDTFIFILRKKNTQLSFLHVYHHSTMPMLWWIGVRWVAGGQTFFSAMINSFIHAVMYSYYLLAAFGPRIQKYLWWKKYLTSMQLAQFISIIVHTSLGLYFDCGYPRGYLYALVVYVFSHIVLFGNFFKKTYLAPKKQRKADETNGQTNHVINGNYDLRKRSQKPRKDS
ncbi:very long chain fatty acid elongase 4-like [Glandiceps talaboti]